MPPGYDPAAVFGTYVNAGATHTAGTELTIPAGQRMTAGAALADHVTCEGELASGGYAGALNLNGGVTVSGTGTVNLGAGSLIVNGTASGMDGGSLAAQNHYVGDGGSGLFTQTGGIISSQTLYLGCGTADSGTYLLNGGGFSGSTQYVGYSGTGRFIHGGGTNSVGLLYLGNNVGTNGTYSLTGSAQLLALILTVGDSGSGCFTQTGGTSSFSEGICLGNLLGSSGTFSLSAGQLNVTGSYGPTENVGGLGSGTFTHSGGTNSTGSLYLGCGQGAAARTT